MTIDICVTHFGDKYNSKYLDNLEKGIGRNYSADFNFIVKYDCPNQHWDKISFFECDTPRIIMDIDILINSNIDDLLNYEVKEDHLAAFPRWWKNGGCPINGGFYKINPGNNLLALHDKFYSNPEFWIEYYGKAVGTPWKGEQDFVYHSTKFLVELPGEWLGVHTKGSARYDNNLLDKYKYNYNDDLMYDNKFGDQVKLVHFIYDDNLIENQEQWIQDLWNII